MKQRSFFKTVLTLYGVLPFLCTAGLVLIKSEYSTLIVPDLAAAVFQAVSIPLIISIKNRKTAFSIFSVFIICTVIISLFLGRFQSSLYNQMLIKYYPGPALTIAYTMIFRFSPFREMETMGRSIRFFQLLLLSYMLMVLMISAYNAVQNNSALFLIPDIIEVLNYGPSILLLQMLSASCKKELTITDASVIYHNTDYTSMFNPLEQRILRQLCLTAVVRCRDFASPEASCPDKDYCKATQCSEYSRIYRNVFELSKKLRNLGLGEIIPPENKRDVVNNGWTLKLYENISIKRRKRAPGIVSVRLDILHSTKSTYSSSSRAALDRSLFTPAAMVVFLLGTLFLSINIVQPVGYIDTYHIMLIELIEAGLFLIPFIFNKINKFKTGVLIFTSILLALFFVSLSWLSEYFAFVQLIKHLSLLLILLMLNLSLWEKNIQMTAFRSQASIILFWSVWFYMASSMIVSEMYLLWPEILKVLDKMFLYTFMVLAVLFHSLPRKKLEIRKSEIFINDTPLPEGLSEINKNILIDFLTKPDNTMNCIQLLKISGSTQETLIEADCDINCKSSACKPYKRLYKRIVAIRRYLESNGLGTIRNIERKQGSESKPGWILNLNEDIF